MNVNLRNGLYTAAAVVSLIAGAKAVAEDAFVGLVLIAFGILATSFASYFWWRSRSDPYRLRALEHHVKIDLLDSDGKRALQTRTTRFRSLTNGVRDFTDHLSADGAYENIEVEPGTIENVRREGGDLFITSNFERVLRKDEEVYRTIRATLVDSFVEQSEYWSVRIIVPTDEFTLTIIFPADRPCRSFHGYRRITSHEVLAGVQPERKMVEQRPAVEWRVEKPSLKDVYKLVWHW